MIHWSIRSFTRRSCTLVGQQWCMFGVCFVGHSCKASVWVEPEACDVRWKEIAEIIHTSVLLYHKKMWEEYTHQYCCCIIWVQQYSNTIFFFFFLSSGGWGKIKQAVRKLRNYIAKFRTHGWCTFSRVYRNPNDCTKTIRACAPPKSKSLRIST